jgi:hypothetical protein
LDLDRYDAPRSYHASRAFAEMSAARAEALERKKRRRRSKVWLAAVAVVVVTAVAGAVLARHYV